MADVMNIFQAAPEAPASSSAFDLDKLTEQFKQQRNTDWSVPEAFLCLLLAAASVDGNVSVEEQGEIYALARRSRALKTVSPSQLAAANTSVNERLKNRPNGLQEACQSLPMDMRLPVFAHCVDIILADGALLPVEADYLNKIMAFMQLDANDAKRIMEVLLVKNRF
ncbi:MAG TPA: TerB family tellurite resistance protein [Hyphomonadaceae bacterium]|nr:TerB family tellurite resistance protein [Hyphomonadaceae bacterium]